MKKLALLFLLIASSVSAGELTIKINTWDPPSPYYGGGDCNNATVTGEVGIFLIPSLESRVASKLVSTDGSGDRSFVFTNINLANQTVYVYWRTSPEFSSTPNSEDQLGNYVFIGKQQEQINGGATFWVDCKATLEYDEPWTVWGCN